MKREIERQGAHRVRILAIILTRMMRPFDAVAMTNQKLSGSITFNVTWK